MSLDRVDIVVRIRIVMIRPRFILSAGNILPLHYQAPGQLSCDWAIVAYGNYLPIIAYTSNTRLPSAESWYSVSYRFLE